MDSFVVMMYLRSDFSEYVSTGIVQYSSLDSKGSYFPRHLKVYAQRDLRNPGKQRYQLNINLGILEVEGRSFNRFIGSTGPTFHGGESHVFPVPEYPRQRLPPLLIE